MASIEIKQTVDIEDEDLIYKIVKEVGAERVLEEIEEDIDRDAIMQRAMYWMPYTFDSFLKYFKEYMSSMHDKHVNDLLLVLVELKEKRSNERGS
tara:strand:+ start:934 stop:1218 length:285 start_codon:yes stop_codon:yes gene_type:complete